jgi:methylthioribose-1-phosphate isomerase
MRSIEWDDQNHRLMMIDQRILPGQLEVLSFDRYQAVAEAITTMVVRGAPAIGVAAAFGMALAGFQSGAHDLPGLKDDLAKADDMLRASRPTAVNLPWALGRINRLVQPFQGSAALLRKRLLEEAQAMAEEDVATNRRISEFGAVLINDGDTIIHHCNTGALATVDWGTALGVIRMAHEQGKRVHVLVDETRPRLQGARLTAWELQQYGIPYEIIPDGAAGLMMRRGLAQKVLFGADRVAANGDVANKIGTYMLALAAYDNAVPAYAVFPTSTVDLTLGSGDQIPIEERSQAEVLDIQVHHQPVMPQGATARNPAFDVTPHRLIAGLITEKGVIYPPFHRNLPEIILR